MPPLPQIDLDSTPLFKNEWKKVEKPRPLTIAAFLLVVFLVFSLIFFILFQTFFGNQRAVVYSLLASSVSLSFLVLFNRAVSPEANMFYSSVRSPAVRGTPIEEWVEEFLNRSGRLYTRKQRRVLFHRIVTFTLSNGPKVEILRWTNGLDVRVGPDDGLNPKSLEELRSGISETVLVEFRKRSADFLHPLTQDERN